MTPDELKEQLNRLVDDINVEDPASVEYALKEVLVKFREENGN